MSLPLFAYNPITGQLDRVGESGGTPGSGDVSGPGSSTDNNIVIFSGTTGKIIKDTGISSINPTFAGTVSALNFNLPQTATTPSNRGIINMAGSPFIHAGVGTENFFAGIMAGNLTETSVGSTGVGVNALNLLSSGISNTAFGHYAMGNGVSVGSFNTACGEGAMFSCGGAVSGNVAVGWHSLIGVSTDYNTAVGYDTMNSGVSGTGNVAVGFQALKGITNATMNVAIGYQAGFNYSSSESNNICISHQGVNSESNTTRIGNVNTTRCFLYGVNEQILENGKVVVIDANTDQVATLTGSPSVAVKSQQVSILTTGPKSLMTIDRDFVITQIISFTLDAVGAVSDSQSSLGYNSPTYDNIYVGGLTFPANNSAYSPITMPLADYDAVPAGSEIFLNVSSVDTSATTYDVQVVLVGYYL